MALKISGVLIVTSFICSFFTGTTDLLTEAAISGASRGVTVSFSLLSMMILWGGIMKVMEKSGLLNVISRILAPILKLAFPGACKTGKGVKEISVALTANFLGVGNAATPLALNAVKELSSESDIAGNDLITFTLLGCAPICFFPTTVVSLRDAAGSRDPTSIVPSVIVCSSILAIISVILSRIMSGGKKCASRH